MNAGSSHMRNRQQRKRGASAIETVLISSLILFVIVGGAAVMQRHLLPAVQKKAKVLMRGSESIKKGFLVPKP